MPTTAIAALASATVIRPDAPAVSPALDGAVRSACDGAWSAVEIVFAGEALRAPLADAHDAEVMARTAAVWSMFGEAVPPRRAALVELRAARREGALDAKLDLIGLVASCGRAGDAPAVQAGRRRVRTIAIEALPRTLASYHALSLALRESAVSAFLVDAARAIFRHATRGDRDLARWAVAPTGSTTREQALTACAELVGSTASRAALERLISIELGEPLPAGAVIDDAKPVDPPGTAPRPAEAEAPAVPQPSTAAPPSTAATDVPITAPIATPITPQVQPSGELQREALQPALVTAPIAAPRSTASPAPTAASWMAPSLLVLVVAVAALIYLIR